MLDLLHGQNAAKIAAFLFVGFAILACFYKWGGDDRMSAPVSGGETTESHDDISPAELQKELEHELPAGASPEQIRQYAAAKPDLAKLKLLPKCSSSENVGVEGKKIVRILAFGDSLTEGMYGYPRTNYHPYTIQLKKLFQQCRPDLNVEIDNAGVSGEVIKFQLYNRLAEVLSNSKNKYEWVIILGGTNDIGKAHKKAELLEGDLSLQSLLQEMYGLCNLYGSNVVAVTVPDIGSIFRSSMAQSTIDRLNTYIRLEALADSSSNRHAHTMVAIQAGRWSLAQGADANPSFQGTKSTLLDLGKLIPQFDPKDFTAEDKSNQQYWSDGVHFSPDGYDLFGTALFNLLSSQIQ
mmetsp:Transcript_10879/g.17814  ORF Transcript_10879/g.17814 Transcript_10879/m.17814 type:complete len:351 (-) Transcript_10879:27-1079(-)